MNQTILFERLNKVDIKGSVKGGKLISLITRFGNFFYWDCSLYMDLDAPGVGSIIMQAKTKVTFSNLKHL